MALTWELGHIKEYETVCFIKATAADEMRDIKVGDRLLKADTEGLIWATMAVGIGQLTERTAAEFYSRLAVWDRMHETPAKSRVQWETVVAHIGLVTNVPYESEAKWLKRTVGSKLQTLRESVQGNFQTLGL